MVDRPTNDTAYVILQLAFLPRVNRARNDLAMMEYQSLPGICVDDPELLVNSERFGFVGIKLAMATTTLETLGRPNKRTKFSYEGSMQAGVVLHQTGRPKVEPTIFKEAFRQLAGRTIKGGFKEDDPPQGGFGEWLQNESSKHNFLKLTPRHGSFVAAILVHEGGVKRTFDGNAVVLHFPK